MLCLGLQPNKTDIRAINGLLTLLLTLLTQGSLETNWPGSLGKGDFEQMDSSLTKQKGSELFALT